MKLFKVFLTFCLSSLLISCNTAKDLLKGIKNENNTDVNVSDDEKKEEDNNPSSGGSSNNPSQGGSSSTPTKKKYTINFFNGDDKLGFLTLDEGTTVGKNTYPNIPLQLFFVLPLDWQKSSPRNHSKPLRHPFLAVGT